MYLHSLAGISWTVLCAS